MCSCVKLLIYSMYPVKLRKQDNQICSGTVKEVVYREKGEERCGRGATQEADQGVCSSTTERTIYGNRCRDLIGQPGGLEVSIGWEPHSRSHARTNSLSRTFYYGVTDTCVVISGVHCFSRRFHYHWLMAEEQVPHFPILV